jgi:hypothetical protein
MFNFASIDQNNRSVARYPHACVICSAVRDSDSNELGLTMTSQLLQLCIAHSALPADQHQQVAVKCECMAAPKSQRGCFLAANNTRMIPYTDAISPQSWCSAALC